MNGINTKVLTDNIGHDVQILDFSVIYSNVVLGDNIIIGEHNVLGKIPTPTKNMKKIVDLKGKPTVIGSGCRFGHNVTLYSDVNIGEEVLLGDNVSIFTNVQIGDSVLISRNVTINSETRIGNNSRIMDNSHVTGRCNIGEHVFISVGVSMANDNLFGKKGFNEDCQGPTIGDYVSIGAGAILLPGVIIGRGAIVAAGSVVKENVPDGVIFAGNPGKIITRVPAYMNRIPDPKEI